MPRPAPRVAPATSATRPVSGLGEDFLFVIFVRSLAIKIKREGGAGQSSLRCIHDDFVAAAHGFRIDTHNHSKSRPCSRVIAWNTTRIAVSHIHMRVYLGLIGTLLIASVSVSSHAQQTADPTARVVSELTAILEERWYPEPTDPRWLDLKPHIDGALATEPAGGIATLARRAAVRIEVTAHPIISITTGATSFEVDTRPWFILNRELPYFVTIYASKDGEAWIELATAYSGSKCGVRSIDVGWPSAIGFGFHRVSLFADVAYLSAAPRQTNRCSITTNENAPESARKSPVRVEPRLVIGRERRMLPAMSFGLHDTRASRKSPSDRPGVWTQEEERSPSYDAFIQAAQRAQLTSPDLTGSRPSFAAWLNQLAAPYPASARGRRIEWVTDFCDPDESTVYHGFNEGLWLAVGRTRRTARPLCVTAAVLLTDRTLVVRLKIATVHEDAGEWQFVEPEFYEGYAESAKGPGGRDLASLNDVPGALEESPDVWPMMAVSISPLDITLDPPEPKPGQQVTVTVAIRNVGSRAIPAVYGTLNVGPSFEKAVEIQRDFYGALPIGESLLVSRTVLSSGPGVFVSVCLFPFPPGNAFGGMRRYTIDIDNGCAVRAVNTPAPPDGSSSANLSGGNHVRPTIRKS
jgi:hypothetical protein